MSFLFLPNLGFPEIVMILVLALLIFGPKKLPEIGRSLGKSFREFKRGTSGFMESMEKGASDEESAPQALPRADAKVVAGVVDEGESPAEEIVIKVDQTPAS